MEYQINGILVCSRSLFTGTRNELREQQSTLVPHMHVSPRACGQLSTRRGRAAKRVGVEQQQHRRELAVKARTARGHNAYTMQWFAMAAAGKIAVLTCGGDSATR